MIPRPCFYFDGTQVRDLRVRPEEPARDVRAKLQGLPDDRLRAILRAGPTRRRYVNPPELLRLVADELARRHMAAVELEDRLDVGRERAVDAGVAARLARRWVP